MLHALARMIKYLILTNQILQIFRCQTNSADEVHGEYWLFFILVGWHESMSVVHPKL